MPTQDAPAFMITKLAGLALLVVGGLIAAYGVRYGAHGATLSGALLAIVGVILLILKIVRRNQDYS